MQVTERRRAAGCTCGAAGATYGDPHRQGCPRYRDRSKAKDVLFALQRRYSKDGEWLFYEEAWDIDALAVRCWSSGIGHRRVAFEVKVSRSDFLSEIRNPAKRQLALDVSHQFFFVTPKGLVQPGEIPGECGLIEVLAGNKTRTVVRAPVRDARALKMSEAIYLMRLPLYRGGILQLRSEVIGAENTAEHFRTFADHAEGQAERAKRRLVEMCGHLVTVGSRWTGSWQPYHWQPVVHNVECFVAEMRGEGYVRVTLRRVDNGEILGITTVEDLLTNFSLLTQTPE